MTTITFHKFSEFGFTEEKTRTHRYFHPHTETHRQYTPYIEVGDHGIPRLMDITNHPARVHLKHEKQRKDLSSASQKEGVYTSFDSRKILDLGVAPLQRIINELRSLSTDANEEHYDHRKGKASDLPDYCDYIRCPGAGRTTGKSSPMGLHH